MWFGNFMTANGPSCFAWYFFFLMLPPNSLHWQSVMSNKQCCFRVNNLFLMYCEFTANIPLTLSHVTNIQYFNPNFRWKKTRLRSNHWKGYGFTQYWNVAERYKIKRVKTPKSRALSYTKPPRIHLQRQINKDNC